MQGDKAIELTINGPATKTLLDAHNSFTDSPPVGKRLHQQPESLQPRCAPRRRRKPGSARTPPPQG